MMHAMKKTLCLSLAVLLCLSALPRTAAGEGEKDPWAAAFDGTARLRLTPAPEAGALPAVEGRELTLLDLSPDGKTALCLVKETIVIEPEPAGSQESPAGEGTRRLYSPGFRLRTSGPRTETVYGLGLVRDRTLTPVVINPDRGVGDPHDAWRRVQSLLPGLPGTEGFSWSADGRYITFSDVRNALIGESNMANMNVPVIDTAAGEMWFADSYQDNNLFREGFGVVYLSKMSRDGRYVFWLAREQGEESWVYRFCRRAPEGGAREVLCEIPWQDREFGFRLMTSSDLFEEADGSWVLSGVLDRSKGALGTNALVRFAPAGETWTAETQSTGISIRVESIRFDRSAASGSGVMALVDRNSTSLGAATGMYDDGAMHYTQYALGCLNLLRILPGETPAWDVWHLEQTGEDAVLASGEASLRYIRALVAGEEVSPPEDFDIIAWVRNPPPLICNACLSPDGRYALLTVQASREWRFYLAQLETMEVRPVYARRGLADMRLAVTTPQSKKYRPGMVWNPDGTLLIMNEFGAVEGFRLETW